jgi:hypothetical protein
MQTRKYNQNIFFGKFILQLLILFNIRNNIFHIGICYIHIHSCTNRAEPKLHYQSITFHSELASFEIIITAISAGI